MTQMTAAVRLPVTGAVLAVLMLVSFACSDDAISSPDESSSAAAVSTTSDITSTLPVGTPTTAPIDPASTLQQGLAGQAAGYHFHSVVTVNGVETLVADGDRIGESSRLTLTREGSTVAYIITPTGSYAQPEFGDWELLDVAPATSDPIAALSAPVAVTLVQADGAGNVLLQVTLTAVSIGIAAEGNVDVDVSLVNGVITRIMYATTAGGSPATTVSDIGPLADATPIVAPI
jgi:hypothetical protein